ncbi:MAG: FecR domain-containing protein, partial [Bacteroidota bacterium]
MKDELLYRYLAGESSEEETKKVNQWRKSSPENEAYLLELEQLWTASQSSNEIQTDTSMEWDKLQKSIHSKSRGSFRWLKYAAALVPVGLALFLLLWYPFDSNDLTISNSEREPKSVLLPDSTVVWLRTGSSIRYPESFEKESREVELIGEGYFEVKSKKNHPFIASIERAKVRVLGTAIIKR